MGIYQADRSGVVVDTIKRHEPSQLCDRCGHEKTLEAFQSSRAGTLFKVCTSCMQDARRATLAAQGKGLSGRPLAEAPALERTPVPVTELGAITAATMQRALSILNMLDEARAEVMTVREWVALEVQASAILSGADLFVYDHGRVWLRRPGGSNVNESVEMATVLALAGDRDGVVFY